MFAQKPQALTKNESIDLIVHSHAKTYSGAETNSNAILKIIFDHHFQSAESLRGFSTNSLIDLLIFLQRPERRLNEYRSKVMPLIEEKTKGLTSGYLLNYIRRVSNIADTTPAYDTLNVVQSKNVLEFLAAQENIKDISPQYLYSLIEKIITDAKSSVRGTPDLSFSKLFEKHRIESNINILLNKIPRDSGMVTEKFIETMIFQNANLAEVPQYFIRTIKNVISNGLASNKD